jgi:Cof subfamily protein (haloacid dehalogenase superfamily)
MSLYYLNIYNFLPGGFMYKLVALDMDGTLLTDMKKISDNNKEAILKCRELGVKFVLSTGRPLSGIKKYLQQLNLIQYDNYSVLLNGALVQNNKTENTYYEKGLTYQELLEIKNFAYKNGYYFYIFTDKFIYSEAGNFYAEYESKENNIPLIIGSFADIKDDKILKLVFGDNKERLNDLEKILPEEFKSKFSIMRSSAIFFELLNKKISKGTGVNFLANLYNLKKEEIICMGDAGNDISMLQYAGLPIAPANAFPEVKKFAKYITASNEKDGVAEALNKFILK